jgi:hypothetical protein
VRVKVIDIKRLPIQKLKGLCLPHGAMKSVFKQHKELEGTAFLLINRLKIIGWAFVAVNDCYLHPYNQFGIFVADKFRRQRCGTKLYNEAKKHYTYLNTSPHDFVSEQFFEKVEQ